MNESIENKLDRHLDWILHQLTKGNTIEWLKRGVHYTELERVKEWKSKYGYQFQIFPNDHLIDNKPHFHLIKKSEDVDCRVFFDGTIYDYKGTGRLDKRCLTALQYFLENETQQKNLKDLWNKNNPKYIVQ